MAMLRVLPEVASLVAECRLLSVWLQSTDSVVVVEA